MASTPCSTSQNVPAWTSRPSAALRRYCSSTACWPPSGTEADGRQSAAIEDRTRRPADQVFVHAIVHRPLVDRERAVDGIDRAIDVVVAMRVADDQGRNEQTAT